MFWKSVEVTPFTRYRCNIGPTNTKILVTSYLFNYERIHECCKWGHILVLQTRVINRINTEKHYNVHIRIVCRPFIEKYFRQFVVDKRPLQLTVFDKRVIWRVTLTYFTVARNTKCFINDCRMFFSNFQLCTRQLCNFMSKTGRMIANMTFMSYTIILDLQ